eukprot:7024013-Alexandrium_andersonii.AAC.1
MGGRGLERPPEHLRPTHAVRDGPRGPRWRQALKPAVAQRQAGDRALAWEARRAAAPPQGQGAPRV